MKPTGSVNVEIIVTGDELLYGRILDTNSHWIAQRVAEMGAKLRRVTMIGDEPETIAAALHDALKRDAHFIIFSGGLGPSEDDLTVDSIGEALERRTVIDEEGAEKIRAVYRRRGTTDDATYRRGERMARVLEGSTPMQNPVGFSVGMCVEEAGKKICTLPGVSSEMRGMFDAHIAPMIASTATSVFLARTYYISMVWRDFFPLYREMQLDYPDTYIKNAATPPVEGEDRDKVHTIKVDIVLEAPTQEEAEAKMSEFLADYMSRIEAAGGGRMEPVDSGNVS
ncbi:MAG TPA: competence/damage-inducible protein A [Candidatus Krumholzibacteriaceae bacterium]|nr:competence/damage-inducible protein A [Candidatus Krumholzibacteriaceae bacterium]